MQRNLAQSLFEHGRIRTTVPKARDLRPFAERLITLAKRARSGSLIARRRIHQLMGDRSLIPAEHREAYEQLSDAKRRQVLRARSGRRHRSGAAKGSLDFTAESVTHRLIERIAERYDDRPGGYTRMIKLPDRRIGDSSFLAIVELVGDEESPGSVAKPPKSSRRKKADARYALAVRSAKAGRTSKAKADAPADESTAAETDESTAEAE